MSAVIGRFSAFARGVKEDKTGWSAFLKHLKERGLKGVRLITSDACIGLADSAAEFFPEAVRALDQGAGDRGHAQGDPRRREHRGSAREGHPSNREAAWPAPEPRRRASG